MRYLFSRRFDKQRKKLTKPLKRALSERLLLFSHQPFNPLLDNHPLKGTYVGCRSINITGDYRAIYFEERPSVVRFVAIGTHSELYE